MQILILRLLLLCALFSYANARRGRGGRGGSGGGGDGDDDYGYYDGGTSDGGSGSSSDKGSSAPCGWRASQYAFGLPGLYYNGTLKIWHLLDSNTAWEDAEQGLVNYCDNNDRQAKMYEYPAMLLIGPTANESDTNPIHWVLRGHQPAHDYNGLGNVDFWQRWVYIRSSDFVLTNRTTLFTTDYRLDRLEDIDATDIDRQTRVYWRTDITSHDNGTYSSRAEYTEPPPMIDVDDDAYRNMPSWLPGKRTSGYVTFSDICTADQHAVDDYYYKDEIENIRVGPDQRSNQRRPQPQPQPREEQPLAGSSPTLWLEKGVKVDMQDIGAEEMTWSLNTSMAKTIPWLGSRAGGCRTNGLENDGFEWGDFRPLRSYDNRENSPGYIVPWNISIHFGLTFTGSLVKENSTTIKGEKNGKLLFGRDYAEFTKEATDDQEDTGTRIGPSWASTACSLLALLLLVTEDLL